MKVAALYWELSLEVLHKGSGYFPRFQNLKNPSATTEADCRDLTSLCLRLCTLVKLREKAGPPFSRYITWAGPVAHFDDIVYGSRTPQNRRDPRSPRTT